MLVYQRVYLGMSIQRLTVYLLGLPHCVSTGFHRWKKKVTRCHQYPNETSLRSQDWTRAVRDLWWKSQARSKFVIKWGVKYWARYIVRNYEGISFYTQLAMEHIPVAASSVGNSKTCTKRMSVPAPCIESCSNCLKTKTMEKHVTQTQHFLLSPQAMHLGFPDFSKEFQHAFLTPRKVDPICHQKNASVWFGFLKPQMHPDASNGPRGWWGDVPIHFPSSAPNPWGRYVPGGDPRHKPSRATAATATTASSKWSGASWAAWSSVPGNVPTAGLERERGEQTMRTVSIQELTEYVYVSVLKYILYNIYMCIQMDVVGYHPSPWPGLLLLVIPGLATWATCEVFTIRVYIYTISHL